MSVEKKIFEKELEGKNQEAETMMNDLIDGWDIEDTMVDRNGNYAFFENDMSKIPNNCRKFFLRVRTMNDKFINRCLFESPEITIRLNEIQSELDGWKKDIIDHYQKKLTPKVIEKLIRDASMGLPLVFPKMDDDWELFECPDHWNPMFSFYPELLKPVRDACRTFNESQKPLEKICRKRIKLDDSEATFKNRRDLLQKLTTCFPQSQSDVDGNYLIIPGDFRNFKEIPGVRIYGDMAEVTPSKMD